MEVRNIFRQHKKLPKGIWGTCNWEMDSSGTLIIHEGVGSEITSMDSVPWHINRDEIVSVIFNGKVSLNENSPLNYMFYHCENLVSVDLSGFDTSNAVSMECMFHSCTSLEEIVFGDEFDTSRVLNMSRMFYKCSKLQKIELQGIDTSNVSDMNSMFENCSSLVYLDLSEFNTSSLIGMSGMFRNCSNLRGLNVSGFNTSKVSGMSGLFSSCSSLETLDLSSFDTSNVINMISLFMNCGNLTRLDLSGFNTKRVSDMSMMFCNCKSLKSVDLSGFNTANVIDMSGMFFSCNSLETLDLSGFNTSKVLNMQNMFVYCNSLMSVNMSGFNTTLVSDMDGMFSGCSSLSSVSIGRKFSFKGDGNTLCQLPSTSLDGQDIMWTSDSTKLTAKAEELEDLREDTYYIRGRNFNVYYKGNGGKGQLVDDHGSYTAEVMPVVLDNSFEAPENYVFKEWNTKKNGKGLTYQPEDKLRPICADVNLYAIWATMPEMTEPEDIQPIHYGEKLDLKYPIIEDNNGTITNAGVEISPNGMTNWEFFDPNTVLSVRYDGYYLRYFATNFVGTAYTREIRISISKAVYDMSAVEWEYEEAFVYDGTLKQMLLKNVPEGLKVYYNNNEETQVGVYTAVAVFEYDVENYEKPDYILDCNWEIRKAVYDMSRVTWGYDSPFIYDGTEKTLVLNGLCDGLTVEYQGNKAVDVGVYTAVASISYDQRNYEQPADIEPCFWGIRKASYDMSNVAWSYDDAFIYDGSQKQVYLSGLPEGVTPKYEDNLQTDVGLYKASVTFEIDDDVNYKMPEVEGLLWQIKKASYSMENVYWRYNEAFEFDGSIKSIELVGLPDGVTAEYYGNSGIAAGEYEATAVLNVRDPHNYNIPDIESCKWMINKTDYDLNDVYWDYQDCFVYDGDDKVVTLVGLPTGVYPVYDENVASNAGEYFASATLEYDSNNYNEPRVEGCSWRIDKAVCDTSKMKWNYAESFSYTGEALKVSLEGLPGGVSAVYSGNEAVVVGNYLAEATLVVDDERNYETPTVDPIEWEIRKAVYDMSEVVWNYEDNFTYDGQPKVVELVGLPSNLSAVYSGNTSVDAGQYTAHVKLEPFDKENYETPYVDSLEWSISKARYDMYNAVWSYEQEYQYDGQEKSIWIRELPEGVTANYIGNKKTEAGEYLAEATFTVDDPKNYFVPEEETCQWRIKRAFYDMTEAVWDYEGPFVYDGSPKMVKVHGLPQGVTPVYCENMAVFASTYIAVASFEYDERNYEMPTMENCCWTIDKAEFDLNGVHWEYDDYSAFTYDGREKSVELVDLPEGATALYEVNTAVDAGTYLATAFIELDDSDNYYVRQLEPCGWRIDKSPCDMSNVHWVNTENLVYDGTQKCVYVEGLPNGVTVEYNGNGNINAGEYTTTAVFDVVDKRNFIVPEPISCTWSISKAECNMQNVTWTYKEAFVYDKTTKKVQLLGLPEGVSAVYEGNMASYAGTYKASATLSVKDTENYLCPSVEDCNWTILKGEYDVSNVLWNYNEDIYYDGNEKAINIEGLPDGVTPIYTGHVGVYAGKYRAEVELQIDNPDNYNVPVVEGCSWEIKKGFYDMQDVYWDYHQDMFEYDGERKHIYLKGLPAGVTASYTGNNGINTGIYVAKAVLSVEDYDNYNAPIISDCPWEIKKGQYDMSAVKWNYNEVMVYDGKEKTVALEGLPEGIFVRYGENSKIEAGSYTATASFVIDTNNYEMPSVSACRWEIEKAMPDMSGVRWNYEEPFVYDGVQKYIALEGVPAGMSVEYSDNSRTEAGVYSAKATVTIRDTRNYIIPEIEPCQWEIEKTSYDMSNVYWDYDISQPFEYDGSPKGIYLKGIPEGVYVNYIDNSYVQAGVYEAKADFEYDTNNYHRPRTSSCQWEIKKSRYDMSEVRWDYDEAFTYDGREKQIFLNGMPDGLTPHYRNNRQINAGMYNASATFSYDKNNYEMPTIESCPWEIKKASYDMSNIRWSYDGPFRFDGKKKTVTIDQCEMKKAKGIRGLFGMAEKTTTTGLPEGVSVTYEGNSYRGAGRYTATAVFSVADPHNYETPQIEDCNWEISKAAYDMSSVRWDYTEAFVYDGTEKSIILKGLPEGIVAEYEGNVGVNAGVYVASVKLSSENSDNYELPEPLKECSWRINKGTYDMSSAFWEYDNTFVYDGIEKRVMITGIPAGVGVTYSGNVAVDAGSYVATAMFTASDPLNYNDPVMESLKWTIDKKVYDMSSVYWDYAGDFTYDGREKTVQLKNVPDGVRVRYSENRGINAGGYVAKAELTAEDPANYEVPELGRCKWRIGKAVYNMSNVVWDYVEPFTYDERVKAVYLKNLPEGITPHYNENSKIDAGVYIATAELEYDIENYEMPVVESCRWKIDRATYNMSNVAWAIDERLVYDSREKSIHITGLPEGVTPIYVGNRGIDAGTYTAKVSFSYDEENFYEPDVIPSCKWTIEKANAVLTLHQATYKKYNGDKAFNLEYDTNAEVMKYRVSDTSVAVISSGGKVTIMGPGKAIITIIADGDNFNEITKEVVLTVLE